MHGNEEQILKVTVSCGVSTCVPDFKLIREKLLKNADRALYKAKEEGRNRVEFRPCEMPVGVGESSSAGKTSAVRRLAKQRETSRLR